MRIRSAVVALCLSVSVAACGGGGDSAEFVLDGTPRPADDAGRLGAVAGDFSTLTLDGESLSLADEVASFSAIDGSLHPLRAMIGEYVQVGIEDGRVIWVGSLSAVVDLPGEDPVAYFPDVLQSVTDGVARFRSGTVVDVAVDVEVPAELPAGVVATIHVESDRVVAFEPG